MSARRIQRQRNADPRMTRIQVHRQDAVTKKKEERAIKEQYRRERKIESYLADDENFPSFSTQLGKLGLQLRDIPGDGNCLFRALGDQMEGHGRNHFKYRFDVVKYMMEHRDDFEPFVEDDIPFERHILNLKKLGTYAGNDAIVAFARLNQSNVVIHQLSAPFLLIQGTQTVIPSTRQIHIAYHNGDHYSSVRKLNDNTESPANIRIQVGSENKTHGKGEYKDGYKYMGLTNGHVAEGIVSAVRDQHIIEEEVMMATNCTDIVQIREALLDCDYDVELTIPHMLQIMELSAIEDTTSLASQQTSTDSGMWSDTGNGFRYASVALTNGQHKPGTHIREDSYGGSSGYGSVSSQNGGARPKLPMQQEKPMSAKQRRETKKIEKKKRAEERNKLKFQTKNQPPVPVNDDASAVTVVSKEIGMMKI